MDFIDMLKQFSKRAEKIKDELNTEEATKNALIMPFFQMLGYDVFNPFEFIPEFVADVCSKKGEKVDYAIMIDEKPTILIEAKNVADTLGNHDAQLYRYFTATDAKFAILTNGIIYKFFSDLEEKNIIDKKPFFEFNLLNIDESKVSELKKFCRNEFDLDTIINTASELKYTTLIKEYLNSELQSPSDEFVKFIISGLYQGFKTQSVIDEFRPIVKKSFTQFVTNFMNEKFKTLIEIDEDEILPENNESIDLEYTPKIITTTEELVAFDIVKNLLKDCIDSVDDITYKDTESYFGILYKNNTRKWICRLKLSNPNSYRLIIPDENKKEQKFNLNSIADLVYFQDALKRVVENYK